MRTWSTAGLDLHLTLPRGRGRRAALEEALREAVASGRLRAGERLPSTRALARDLGAARGTVAEAYAQLTAEGWLRARRGSGTVVAEVAAARPPRRGREAAPERAPRFDLRPGQPDVSSFPRAAWLRALRAALAEAPDAAFRTESSRGLPELREALAGYLARARGVRAEPEQVVICGGFRQGLALVCRALRRAGSTRVALESPTIQHLRSVAEATGMDVLDVAVDADGLQTATLHESGAAAAVVTPAHQFPMGVTLAAERRAALIGWARHANAVVIEDDYDGEFRYDRQPVGALQALDPERVVYAGTASKVLAPALRLAWLVLPPGLVDAVAAEKELDDGSSPLLEQLALAELIRRHELDRHIRGARQRYRHRRDRLLEAVAERAPAVRPRGIAAGLHALLELPPEGPGEHELTAAAERRGLAIRGLGSFHHARAPGRPALVVGYATPPEHAYEGAVRALAALLADS